MMNARSGIRTAALLLLLAQSAFSQNGGFYDSRFQTRLAEPAPKPAALVANTDWQLDSMHCEDFDGTIWQPDYNTYYGYDALSRQVYDSTVTWDHMGQLWRPATLLLSKYLGGSDQLDRSFELSWDGPGWGQDTFRTLNIYENGQLIETHFDTRSPDGQIWFSNGRQEYVYDDEGRVIQRFSRFYDEASDLWVLIGRASLQYLGDLVQEEITEFTNDGGQTWENFSRFLYTIENGRVTQLDLDTWQSGQWAPFFRSEFTYDSRDLMVHSDSYQFNAGWKPTQRCDFFYGEQTTAVYNPVAPLITLQMANPFYGGIVSAPELDNTREYRVTLYAIDGKPVYDVVASGNRWELPAPQTPGPYVLIVRDGNRVAGQRKVLVDR